MGFNIEQLRSYSSVYKKKNGMAEAIPCLSLNCGLK